MLLFYLEGSLIYKNAGRTAKTSGAGSSKKKSPDVFSVGAFLFLGIPPGCQAYGVGNGKGCAKITVLSSAKYVLPANKTNPGASIHHRFYYAPLLDVLYPTSV